MLMTAAKKVSLKTHKTKHCICRYLSCIRNLLKHTYEEKKHHGFDVLVGVVENH